MGNLGVSDDRFFSSWRSDARICRSGLSGFLDARFISHFRAIVRHLSTGSVASDEVGAVCELIDSVLFLDGRV